MEPLASGKISTLGNARQVQFSGVDFRVCRCTLSGMQVEISEWKEDSAPAAGFYEDVPFEVYCSWPYLNHSVLKQIHRSPAHARLTMDRVTESTEYQIVGQVLHTAILEPHEIGARYAVIPEEEILDGIQGYQRPKSSKKYKAAVKKFSQLNEGKMLVSDEDFSRIVMLSEAIIDLGLLNDKHYHNEVSLVWRDEETGIWCKGRIDRLSMDDDGHPTKILDIKKHDDNRDFSYAIRRFKYHSQLAFYQSGVYSLTGMLPDPHIMKVETSPPFIIHCAPLAARAVQLGWEKNREGMSLLLDCQASGDWPGPECPDSWDLPDSSYF